LILLKNTSIFSVCNCPSVRAAQRCRAAIACWNVMHELTDADASHFQTFGYVILRQRLGTSEVATIRENIMRTILRIKPGVPLDNDSGWRVLPRHPWRSPGRPHRGPALSGARTAADVGGAPDWGELPVHALRG
jgi:hypothetical protein